MGTTEYDIRSNYGYGHGFETVTTESTMSEAQERLREYRENEPEYPHKIVRVRTTVEKGTTNG